MNQEGMCDVAKEYVDSLFATNNGIYTLVHELMHNKILRENNEFLIPLISKEELNHVLIPLSFKIFGVCVMMIFSMQLVHHLTEVFSEQIYISNSQI